MNNELKVIEDALERLIGGMPLDDARIADDVTVTRIITYGDLRALSALRQQEAPATDRLLSWLRVNMRRAAAQLSERASRRDHDEQYGRLAGGSCILHNTANMLHLWAQDMPAAYDPAQERETVEANERAVQSAVSLDSDSGTADDQVDPAIVEAIRRRIGASGLTPAAWADYFNRMTGQQIVSAMESMPTDVLEFGVRFEALSHQQEAPAVPVEPCGCRKALEELLATVKTVPEMNHQRFDHLGIAVNRALATPCNAGAVDAMERAHYQRVYRNASQCVEMLEGAGMGGAGKPNCLTDMVKEIVAERDSLRAQVAEQGEALRRIAAWPPSYPANQNIDRIRDFARAATQGNSPVIPEGSKKEEITND